MRPPFPTFHNSLTLRPSFNIILGMFTTNYSSFVVFLFLIVQLAHAHSQLGKILKNNVVLLICVLCIALLLVLASISILLHFRRNILDVLCPILKSQYIISISIV